MTATLWTDYEASGGARVGALPVIDGVERTRVDGNETTTLTVPVARWTALQGDVRQVIRIDWPEGTVSERRISKVDLTDGAGTVTLECLPPLADLGTGGPILRRQGTRILSRVAGELAISTAIAQYILPHPAAQRLGLVLGTVERDLVVAFDLDSPTPLALLRALLAGQEPELVRTSGTTWTLHLRAARGATLPPLTVTRGRNQAALALGVDDEALATVVVPLGDADPGTGDRATIATGRWTIDGVDGLWVRLRDGTMPTMSPVQVDTQWVGAWLRTRDGVTVAITGSRASDGAVLVGSVDGLAVGERVAITADSTGAPLVELYDATTPANRRRVVPLTYPVRGEANELPDGGFDDATFAAWPEVNGTGATVPMTREEFGVTLTGAANGSRSAATPGSTPFPIDGLPPNTWLRRGMQIQVPPTVLTTNGWAIAGATGALTLPLSAPLAGAIPDNTPMTLTRVTGNLRINITGLRLSPGNEFILNYLPSDSNWLTLHRLDRSDVRLTLTGTFFYLDTATGLQTTDPNTGLPFVFASVSGWIRGVGQAANTLQFIPEWVGDGLIVMASAVDAVIIHGPFVRETRTVLTNGVQNAGATSLVLRADIGREQYWTPAFASTQQIRRADTTGVYDIASATAWAVDSNGRPTCTVTLDSPGVPTGDTLVDRQSMRVTNSLRASVNPGPYEVEGAVVGPSTTLPLRGGSRTTGRNWYESLPSTAQVSGAYVVGPGSTLAIAGELLEVAASAQADGSGAVSVTLTGPNASAIADNTVLTVRVPPMLRPTDTPTGPALRLFSPVGGSNIPTTSTPGRTSALIPFAVAPGSTLTVTALVTFSLTAGTYPLGQQPAIALVDATGTLVAWGRLADGTAQVLGTPTIARLIVQHTLTASTALALRIYGGATDRALWQVVLDAMLTESDRDDIPFVRDSHANALTLRGLTDWTQRRTPAVSVDVSLTTLRRWIDQPNAPVGIGQAIVLPDYGLTRRVLTIDRSLIDPDAVRVEVGVQPPELFTLVGASA